MKALVSIRYNGRRTVTGNKNLKASQAYPDGFGLAMRSLMQRHRVSLKKEGHQLAQQAANVRIMPRDLTFQGLRGKARWSDAKLRSVFEHLTK